MRKVSISIVTSIQHSIFFGSLKTCRYFSSKFVTACDPNKVTGLYKNLVVGPLKGLYKYLTPTTISLSQGLPLDYCFPIHKIRVDISSHLSSSSKGLTGHDNEVLSYTLTNNQDLLLNYHRGDGIPTLKNWIYEHVLELHRPQYDSFTTCITTGSTDSYTKIIQLIKTDAIIYDQFAYGSAVNMSQALGKRSIGVPTDSYGMVPSALKSTVLSARQQGLTVNLIYLVPVGNNPSGITIPLRRKQELYEVCQELDLIIVEDDSYYYLYFELGRNATGLHNLPKSFLALDTDGRVLRIDSIAKFIAPGMRLGWICGPYGFIEKYMLLQEGAMQFPSGLAQSVFMGLLNKWGQRGFNEHVMQVQSHYQRQCHVMMQALSTYFTNCISTDGSLGGDTVTNVPSLSPLPLCSYIVPTGGMFVWLSFPAHGHLTSMQLFEAFAAAEVLCVPGTGFYCAPVDGSEYSGHPAVRITYAAASPENINIAIRKMAECVKVL